MKKALTSLGFSCQPESASEISVTAPYWRSDISLVEDLVEEVARVIGYDRIPVTMPTGAVPRQDPAPILGFKERVRRGLTGYGFYEVITYSLTGLEFLNRLMPEPHPIEPEPLRVVRPMSAEQEYLRPNLRVNLLAALEANRRHEEGAIRLFELGRVYLRRPSDLPDEPEMLCAVMAGPRLDKSWHGGDGPVDFFDAKGVAEGLLGRLGVEADFIPEYDESLHPARQAAIVIEGKKVGVVGEMHQKVAEAFDLAEPVYLFELNLGELLPFTLEHRLYQPVSRFPAVVRDIALVVDSGVTHRQVADTITGFPLVAQVSLFDLYTGGKLPAGKKSLAYRITFQSPSKTLTDEAANSVLKKILGRLSKELGATLRG
jgi:phenylalanyl-tRNA synthetase beta chain